MLTALGGLVGIVGPGPVGCQALPGAEATGHWLLGLGHEMAGHGKPGDPWGADGLLVYVPGPAMADGMTVVVLELVSAHWWLWPGERVTCKSKFYLEIRQILRKIALFF